MCYISEEICITLLEIIAQVFQVFVNERIVETENFSQSKHPDQILKSNLQGRFLFARLETRCLQALSGTVTARTMSAPVTNCTRGTTRASLACEWSASALCVGLGIVAKA